jgi:DNA end-binding protein Ku
MARSIWTGSISFGLVNVPVRVFPAIREHDVRFHQLDERTGNRIRIERVDEKTGREVGYDHVVKGYETSPGRYVEVTDEELSALKPRTTKTIDIEDFVDLAEIDPIYYKRTYYLAPDRQEGAQKAYALLLHAMIDQGKVGIGKVVMRQKQYLAAIRPAGRVLALSTMLFADEVVDAAKMSEIPAIRTKPAKREIDMAERLVASLTSKWDPRKYKDTYERDVRRLIGQKSKGRQVAVEPAPEEPEKVLDLMSALEASLKRGGPARRTGAKAAPTQRNATRRAPTGRAAAKKAPARKAKQATGRTTSRTTKRARRSAA